MELNNISFDDFEVGTTTNESRAREIFFKIYILLREKSFYFVLNLTKRNLIYFLS